MNDPIGDDPRHGLKIRGLTPNPRAQPLDSPSATGATEASAVDAASETTATEIADPSAIAESLASGAIDAATAQAQLIDSVVATQLPENASVELVASVRAEVEAMLVGSPLLAALLRPS